jgi:hypothetical protein
MHLTTLFRRRYDTGFRLVGDSMNGELVAVMAAHVLLGDERLWQDVSSFFDGERPQILVLSRLELDHSIDSCCTTSTALACHDAFVFRAPLNHSIFHLDPLNSGSSGSHQSENQVVQSLLQAGYELSNPCAQLPLFRYRVPDPSIKRDQTR